MDLRARAVGDILTIVLVERTNASKESSTSTARGSSIDTGFPDHRGPARDVERHADPEQRDGERHAFDGEADSSQSNRLDGSITVTVAERLAERQPARARREAHHDQSRRGIHSPRKASSDPSTSGPRTPCASTKVADAAITYSGRGNLADPNRPGWLTRFFNSPYFPF